VVETVAAAWEAAGSGFLAAAIRVEEAVTQAVVIQVVAAIPAAVTPVAEVIRAAAEDILPAGAQRSIPTIIHAAVAARVR
jgi:hypothetical protein